MTIKQSLKVLYELLEGVNFEEIFYNVYTDILSLSDRTPHGIHHKSFADITKELETDKYVGKALTAIDDTLLGQSEDADLFILNPFEDTDLVILRLHDIAELDYHADALNYYTRYSSDDDTRAHIVNIIITCDMTSHIQRGRAKYAYSILGHEIIHFLFRYLNVTHFESKFDMIVCNNHDLIECICDLWSFILTVLPSDYDRYREMTFVESYKDFLNNSEVVPNAAEMQIMEELNKEEPPTWIKTFIRRLEDDCC